MSYGGGYDAAGQPLPGEALPPTTSTTQWAMGGVAAIAYFVSNLLALIIALCALIFILGLGNIVTNSENAFVTWTYWRIYGMGVVVLPIFLIMFINYQLRKGSAVGGGGGGIYNQGLVNVFYFICTFLMVIIEAWLILCLIWYGIEDIANCNSKGACSGTNNSNTPNPGAIMIMVGIGVAILCIAVELVLELYLWYASRQVITMRVLSSPYAYLASEMGAVGQRVQAPTYGSAFSLEEDPDVAPADRVTL